MFTNVKTDKSGSNPSKKDGWLVSPSQIKTTQRSSEDAEGCDRKWGYVYVEGIRGPSTAAAILGTETHAVLESHFSSGGVPDTSTRPGKLASAALEVYPSRFQLEEYAEITGFDPLIEVGLSFDVDGVRYRGFADMLWTEPRCTCGALQFMTPDGLACLAGHLDREGPSVPVVADHKTSSDPEKWGLTSRTLTLDPQALIYANFGLEWTGSDLVDLQWTYLRTRGRVEAVPVRASMSRAQARENFLEHVHPHGTKIMNLVRAHERGDLTRADQLEPNPRACGAFGGCPHASYCPRSPTAIMTSIFGVSKESDAMNLKEKLAKKHGSKSDKPKGKKDKGKKDKGKKDKGKKDKGKKDKPAAEPVVREKAPKKKDKGKKGKKKDEKVEGKGRTINSPEAPKSPEIAREISERVGQVSGNKKTKPANARTIAEAAVGSTSAEDAAARCQAALDRIGRDGIAPKDMVLIQVASGLDLFAPTKTRAADLGLVYASGRTIMALKRDGAIEVSKVDGTDGGDVYKVSLLEAGRARVTELDPDVTNAKPRVESEDKPKAPAEIETVIKDFESALSKFSSSLRAALGI